VREGESRNDTFGSGVMHVCNQFNSFLSSVIIKVRAIAIVSEGLP
jgi:hypothetical protein